MRYIPEVPHENVVRRFKCEGREIIHFKTNVRELEITGN
jgi:hypothetical protein